MILDIHLRYQHARGLGKCHVRVCRAANEMPLVFVCSQYRNYYGISVTNAVQSIVDALFHHIANERIENLRFDFELPLIQRWHDDANMFDKALVRVLPEKYKRRFITECLDLSKIFEQVIWLEHYSADRQKGCFQRTLNVVKLDDSWHPHWSGSPSEEWLVENTGFSSEELLPSEKDLDLKAVEQRPMAWYEPAEILRSKPGFHAIRWTENLVSNLPGILSAARFYKGSSTEDDLQELSIHDEIRRLFAVQFPSPKLFATEFYVSENFYRYTEGTPKKIDIAIFKPESDDIDSFLEVKRTSSKTQNLKSEVLQDIARLLLLSRNFRCACYLLVCGNTKSINSQLGAIEEYVSFQDHCSYRDKHFAIDVNQLSGEYKSLLEMSGISEGSSRLQGMKTDGSNSVLLWQVCADMSALSLNPPYKCNIKAANIETY
jgi:hypothetical protein